MKIDRFVIFVFLWLLIPVTQVISQQAKPETDSVDFVRYRPAVIETDSDVLETAVVRFQRGDTIVDLVAAVHLGDKVYFDNLNLLLKNYEVVLYEMIGDGFSAKAVPKTGAGKTSDDLSSLSNIQVMAAQLLGLSFQMDGIDYKAPNFVHADVTWEEFQKLKASKNENMATLLTRVMKMAESGGLDALPVNEENAGDFLSGVVVALTTGDSAGLKRKIAPLLSEAEAMIAQLEGDDGTVIVSERNKVVMTKLAEMLAQHERPNKKIAIFYGAGHMPDLEKRLIADGFQKKSTAWASAWNIVDTPVDPSAPSPAKSFFSQIIEENPEVISIIQSFSKALQEAAAESGK